MSSKRGAFILFEGIDRCGKTTQSKRLVSLLQQRGQNVKHIRFPNRETHIGKMIDAYLKNAAELDDRTIHLLFSANRWEAAESIKRDLLDGITVVCDRYSYSGCSYTASKGIPGLDLDWCRRPEAGLPAPDAIFYLDLSVEEAQRRGGYGDERYEKEEMQRRVRENYLALREADEAALVRQGNKNNNDDSCKNQQGRAAPLWCTIDANREPDAIHEDVCALADQTIQNSASAPLGALNWLSALSSGK